jgi:hypothetical protein
METEMGYPMSLWIFASWMSFIPGCDGKRSFRIMCILQGLFDFAIIYFSIQFGLGLLSATSFLIINGLDISPVIGWIILLFGIYLIPLMLYSGFVMLFTGVAENGDPNKFRIYYSSEEERDKMLKQYFNVYTKKEKKIFLDSLNDEQREILTRFIITHANRGKYKKGAYADYYYREGAPIEIDLVWFKEDLEKEIKKRDKKAGIKYAEDKLSVEENENKT